MLCSRGLPVYGTTRHFADPRRFDAGAFSQSSPWSGNWPEQEEGAALREIRTGTVYGYFALWAADGVFDQLTGLSRGKVRQAEGRSSEPSAALIDSRSIRTSATVHLADQGIDPAGKIIGRTRHIGHRHARPPASRGRHRWVIGRTLGRLMHHRRLARDYETHPHRSVAMIQLAAINLVTRRFTHEATTNWPDSQPKWNRRPRPNTHLGLDRRVTTACVPRPAAG